LVIRVLEVVDHDHVAAGRNLALADEVRPGLSLLPEAVA
jgi:hypothetical protein